MINTFVDTATENSDSAGVEGILSHEGKVYWLSVIETARQHSERELGYMTPDEFEQGLLAAVRRQYD